MRSETNLKIGQGISCLFKARVFDSIGNRLLQMLPRVIRLTGRTISHAHMVVQFRYIEPACNSSLQVQNRLTYVPQSIVDPPNRI